MTEFLDGQTVRDRGIARDDHAEGVHGVGIGTEAAAAAPVNGITGIVIVTETETVTGIENGIAIVIETTWIGEAEVDHAEIESDLEATSEAITEKSVPAEDVAIAVAPVLRIVTIRTKILVVSKLIELAHSGL